VTSIADLSPEPKFTIKSVCAQTGIRAVTLRAWERRYHLLEPHRTNGNYRLYSDRDVAVLRWLKLQVDSGMSISGAAATLQEMRRAGRLPEPPLALGISSAAKTATPPSRFASRLYQAIIHLDEESAASVLNEAHAVFDLTTVCVEVMTPCMVEIGEAWHRHEVSVATEHFAAGYVRGRLMTLLQSYPARRGAPRVVVGCAPNERHDVGGLMLAVMLRRDGFRVDFLGADVPIDDIVIYARTEKPAMICISAATDEVARDLKRLHQMLTYLKPAPRFGFGGRAFNANPSLRETTPGIFLGESAAAACATIRQLLA
jgi:methanogenic corrinoid protein MtbC1